MAYRKSRIPDFPTLARKISKAANSRLMELGQQYAEYTREDFVVRIEHQRFSSFVVILYPESGTNLSPQWIERKTAKGADLRTMIATGHYIRSIQVFRRVGKKGLIAQWRVGFHPQARARDLDGKVQKITLETVALIHELGNSNTPARPHWRPNSRRLKRESPAVRRYMHAQVRAAMLKVVGTKMATGG